MDTSTSTHAPFIFYHPANKNIENDSDKDINSMSTNKQNRP